MKDSYGTLNCSSDEEVSTPESSSHQSLEEINGRTPLLSQRNDSDKNWATSVHRIVLAFLLVIFCSFVWFGMQSSSCCSTDALVEEKEKYAYIVIGAGPAGLVAGVNLAKRLEKEAKKSNTIPGKVLILESGTQSQSSVEEQLDVMRRIAATEADQGKQEFFDFPPVNQFDIPLQWSDLNSVHGGGEKAIAKSLSHHWPVRRTFLGRAVGGSGLHNAMINVRALPIDFEMWNVTNWAASDVMPYFTRLESYDSSAPIPEKWGNCTLLSNRGTSGPLKTSLNSRIVDPIADEFIASSMAAGLPQASLGFNEADADKRIGVGYYEFNVNNGLRDSAAKAMLSTDVKVPTNLVVKTGATVQKILFTDVATTPKAVGVRYFSSEKDSIEEVQLQPFIKTIDRKRRRISEVILAAGAILSPQILANSGIHEGGTLVDSSEVGKNIHDHPVIGVVYSESQRLSEAVSDFFNADDKEETAFRTYKDAMNHFQIYGDDDFFHAFMNNSSTCKAQVYGTPGFSVGGFLASPWSQDGVSDLQLTVFPHTVEPHFVSTGKKKITSPKKNSILVTVALLRPDATNTLELANLNSNISKTEPSLINFEKKYKFKVPNILGGSLSSRDTKRLAWGVNEVRNIMSAPPLSRDPTMEKFPGSKYQDDDLENFIKNHVMANSHWSGSTRMGDDKDSVVDSKLNVRGVRGLRIVDAGVMPSIPNGNTHSTTCAIALRGVDLILGT